MSQPAPSTRAPAVLAAEADIRTRLAWAVKCGERLAEDIQRWHRDSVKVVDAIAEDRLSWSLSWAVSTPPPEDWARTFADAIQNLRAALDNLLFAIARDARATEKELGEVQFPILEESKSWPNEKPYWRVAMLPPTVQETIRSLQPFNRPDAERHEDGLLVLSNLNNVEKHRVLLRSQMSWQEIAHSFSVAFEAGGPSTADPPRVEIFGDPPSDGAPILQQDTTPDRISKVRGSFSGSLKVVVLDKYGTEFGVTSVLDPLIRYVDLVLSVVVAAWVASPEPISRDDPTAHR